MLYQQFGIPELFAIVSLTVILYASYLKEGKNNNSLNPLYISIPLIPAVIIGIYSIYSGLIYMYIPILISTTIISSFAVLYYKLGIRFYASIAYLMLITVYGLLNPALQYPLIQALAVGMAVMLSYIKYTNSKQFVKLTKSSKKIEKERDIIQIIIGIAVIFSIVLFKGYQEYLMLLTLFSILIMGITESERIRITIIGKIFHRIEKLDSPYGNGALLLAIGVLTILAFVHNFKLMLFFISVLMFADPMATIVGLSIHGPKLFYNKNKSVYGSLSFFIVGALVGFPLIGFYAIPIAIFLAFVESIKSLFDDNISIAVASLLIYVLFFI